MSRKNNIPPTHPTTQKYISVIIACKNESKNIPQLIAAMTTQQYPTDKYEVIIVDDGSTDDTAQVIRDMIKNISNIKYLHVSSDNYPHVVGKKKAITCGVMASCGEILAFSDADCVPEKDWLADINISFARHTDFYAGYSPHIYPKDNLIHRLKSIERASIFAVTAGSFGMGIPITCTARNMAYTRSLWDKVDGFAGIEHILSGDDDLMLMKSRHHIHSYCFSFLSTAIVHSYEDKDIGNQVQSETRRVSKIRHFPLYVKLLVAFLSIFYSYLLYRFLHVLFSILALSDVSILIKNLDLGIAMLLKILLEFTLIYMFFKKIRHSKSDTYILKKSEPMQKKKNGGKSLSLPSFIYHFLLAEILYIPYFLYFGIRGTFGKYRWIR
jgi:cellulose synthase/poly-beta-1,6-N-acetylglucosamine synthase-like glycosyltransferase